jgi:hypothetical protein
MLATGTGLAPFLSILHDFHTWENYENLVLVQSVRTQQELAYEDLIRGFDKSEYYAEFAHKLRYARIVTREPVPGTLRDRVTKLLGNGVLEENLGVKLDHDRSRIMLCGNRRLVEDSRRISPNGAFACRGAASPAISPSRTTGDASTRSSATPPSVASGWSLRYRGASHAAEAHTLAQAGAAPHRGRAHRARVRAGRPRSGHAAHRVAARRQPRRARALR